MQAVGELPFSLDELQGALALRTTQRIEATVRSDGRGVRVSLRGRERQVLLDGETGEPAARLVAFAILDLAGTAPAPPEAEALVPPVVEKRVVAPVVARELAWSIGAWGSGGSRQEAGLEASIGIAGPLRIVVAGGSGLARGDRVMTTELVRRAFPLRAGIAARFGFIEVRASALALVERAEVQRSSTDIMLGGGAAIAWVRPLGSATVLVGAGGDAFASTIEYRIGGTPLVTTDRFAWWAGLGIAFEVFR